jgi:ankyrin repeat protein
LGSNARECKRDTETCGSWCELAWYLPPSYPPSSPFYVHVNLDEGRIAPLHCAAERGHIRSINALVESGADVNAMRDLTPLHVAARHGRSIAVAHLIALGAQVEGVSSNLSTPLHFAVHGNEAAILTLLEFGADVNACNAHGDTPLHEASACGYVDVVRALVRMGAEVNARNTSGMLQPYPHELNSFIRRRNTTASCRGETRADSARACAHGRAS